MATLHAGAVQAIFNGTTGLKPVLQILELRRVQSPAVQQGTSPERYRVVCSDGTHFLLGMLATQLNPRVASKEIELFSVIRVNDYLCQVVQGRRIMIILSVDVLQQAQGRIGNPTPIDPSTQARDGQQQQQQQHPGAMASGVPAPAPSAAGPGMGQPYGAAPAPAGYGAVPAAPAPHSGGFGGYGAPAAAGAAAGAGAAPAPSYAPVPAGYGAAQAAPAPHSGGFGGYGAPAAAGAAAGAGAAPAPSYAGGGMYGAGGAAAGSLSDATIFPIDALSPYQQRWTIKARVTNKTPVRTFQNQRGEGKLFSIELLDEQGGEIRATFFTTGVDRWYDYIQKNKVYKIARGQLKQADRRYNTLKHLYELTLDANSQIEEVPDDATIQHMHFNFVPIAQLPNLPAEKDAPPVDVMGILLSSSELQSFNSKTKNEVMMRRVLTLGDRDGRSVELTLWHALAQSQNFEELAATKPVLAVKGVKVTDFGGRSLSSISTSVIEANPALPEAYALKGWYDAEGQAIKFVPIGQDVPRAGGGGGGSGGAVRDPTRKTLASVQSEGGAAGQQPEYYNVRACLSFVKHDQGVWYPACPTDECKGRKLTANTDGTFSCEKCQRTHAVPNYRYMLSVQAQDHTGQQWLTVFDDQAKIMLGRPAAELVQLKQDHPLAYEQVFDSVLFRYFVMRCKVQQHEYQGQVRPRHQVFSAAPMDFVGESKFLLEEIRKYGVV